MTDGFPVTDREALLAVVERSPQAAAAHDRAGWVGLATAATEMYEMADTCSR